MMIGGIFLKRTRIAISKPFYRLVVLFSHMSDGFVRLSTRIKMRSQVKVMNKAK